MKRLFTLLLAVLLLLSGCGGTPNDEPDVDWEEFQQEQAAPDTGDEAPDLPRIFPLAYHKGQSLDPITCGEGIQQDIASLLFEPIFQLDQHFEPVPLLCEDYTWDESGLVCTLTVREGVTFNDGTELTAVDVAAAIRRAADSPRYGYRLRQVASATAYSRSNEVVITLTTPDRGLPALLDIPVVKSGTEDQTVPTGSGPYVFITASEGDRLAANQEWWQRKALPLDTIPLVHAKDRDTAMYLFSSHRIELLTADPTGDLLSAAGQLTAADRPTTVLQYIGFNTRSGTFSDPAARTAFSQGIQRDMLVDAFLSGHGQAASFPISPLSPLYPADLAVGYTYDGYLTALEEAGLNTGEIRELKLLVNQENASRLANAQFLAETLSLLDLSVTVQALPWEEYLAALGAGRFDLYYGEVRLTADWDLTDLLGTNGPMNYGGYASEAMDAALADFASAPDRPAAARRLADILRADTPIAPICFQGDIVLTHPGVAQGINPVPGNTFAQLEDWTIHLAK